MEYTKMVCFDGNWKNRYKFDSTIIINIQKLISKTGNSKVSKSLLLNINYNCRVQTISIKTYHFGVFRVGTTYQKKKLSPPHPYGKQNFVFQGSSIEP